jgi:hypothetical protein
LEAGIIKNSVSGKIFDFTGFAQDNFLSSLTTWTFSAKFSNQIPSKGFLELHFPFGFFLDSTKTLVQSIQGLEPSQPPLVFLSNTSIRFQADSFYSVSTTGISFSVSNILNPSTDLSTFFKLYSLDSALFSIDSTESKVQFSLFCSLPCKTCENSNKSSCLSCYSQGFLVNDRILYDV